LRNTTALQILKIRDFLVARATLRLDLDAILRATFSLEILGLGKSRQILLVS
jgi:hypothetical protein